MSHIKAAHNVKLNQFFDLNFDVIKKLKCSMGGIFQISLTFCNLLPHILVWKIIINKKSTNQYALWKPQNEE